MSTDHNRIKVADLEKNQQDKILVTDANGELEFQDIKNIKSENYNALDYTTEGKALDARQGKVLKDLIDTKTEDKSNKTDDIEANKASSVKYTSAKSVVDWFKSFLFPNVSSKTTTFIDTDLILTGDSEDSFKTKTGTFAQLKANLKSYYDVIYQSSLVSGSNIKTVNGTSILGSGNIATPDMNTTTAQTVSGVKTFLNLMLGLRNAANTFTSFITNAATASRTWTFPDKSGTVAMTSDITGVINAGTTNRIPKYVGSTVVGNSRVLDDGSFVGIGVSNAPTKDLTLGNQNNREIGIEQSDSNTEGRDLIVSAGKTINFQLSSNFTDLNQVARVNLKGCASPNGDMYIPSGIIIYKQSLGVGNFNVHTSVSAGVTIYSLAIDSSNNMFIATSNGLYKQTNCTGSLILESGVTTRSYYSMAFHPSGDLYAICGFKDSAGIDYIYKRAGNTGNFTEDIVSTAKYNDIACAPNGDVYATCWGVGLLKKANGSNVWTNAYSQNTIATVCVLLNGTIYMANLYGGILSKFYVSTNNGFSFVNSTIDIPLTYSRFITNKNNVYHYSVISASSIYMQNNDALGASNLGGGSNIIKAGTGKGTGKSRVEFYTGQKTISGTDMQVETMRVYLDENGSFVYLTPPSYANDADADADANLPSKAFYKITGNRTLFQKP